MQCCSVCRGSIIDVPISYREVSAIRGTGSRERGTHGRCGPLQQGWTSAASPAARGSKWSAVQVAQLLGAAGNPFGGSTANGASVVPA